MNQTPSLQQFYKSLGDKSCIRQKLFARVNDYIRNGGVIESSALCVAIFRGESEILAHLLRSGWKICVNHRQDGKDSRFPIHWAAQEGNVHAAIILLSHGAKIDVQADGGFSPLHIAASEGHLDFVRLLIDFGANVKLRCHAADDLTAEELARAWKRNSTVRFLTGL